MRHVPVLFALAALTVMPSTCDTHPIAVQFYLAHGHHFPEAEREAIQSVADAAVIDARHLLPALPSRLVLEVEAGAGTSETGDSTAEEMPNIVKWFVDPERSGGVIAVARAYLRPSLMSRLYTIVRRQAVPPSTLMDWVVTEGLATAFERDEGHGSPPPWGVYPDNVSDWVHELEAMPQAEGWDKAMMGRHPDGRRWVGERAGTYIADRAMRAAGKSSAQLVAMPTADVLRLGF